MANNLVAAENARLVDASFGTAAYTDPTGPMKLRLMTTNGSATSAGTEAAGGSYTPQTIVMGSGTVASPSVAVNSGAINYTAMPAATITGVEVWDSAGTPRRNWHGALTASKTTGAGDTLSFPASSISGQIG